MPWSFNGTTLTVRRGPSSWEDGYEADIFESSGVDGASVLDNRRFPAYYYLSVVAKTPTEQAALEALFTSGVTGDLEVPVGSDHWVYAGAKVIGKNRWRPINDYHAEVQVTVICPSPRPTYKSTGTRVF